MIQLLFQTPEELLDSWDLFFLLAQDFGISECDTLPYATEKFFSEPNGKWDQYKQLTEHSRRGIDGVGWIGQLNLLEATNVPVQLLKPDALFVTKIRIFQPLIQLVEKKRLRHWLKLNMFWFLTEYFLYFCNLKYKPQIIFQRSKENEQLSCDQNIPLIGFGFYSLSCIWHKKI